MPTIVISYRREDSKWIAGRIYDRLEGHFGKGNVFMDIDSIPFGLDFRDHIRTTLDRCDVLVAIVGPNWTGKDQSGERILDETDWVRIELESALNKKIPVIPVLIDRSRMPKPSELPDGLKNFAFRQAASVDTEHFHSHMDKVIASIDQHLAAIVQRSPEVQPPLPHPSLPSGRKSSPNATSQGSIARRLREDVQSKSKNEGQSATRLPSRSSFPVPLLLTLYAVIVAAITYFGYLLLGYR